jgi:hypothetical protein
VRLLLSSSGNKGNAPADTHPGHQEVGLCRNCKDDWLSRFHPVAATPQLSSGRDFASTDELKTILADPECAEWIIANVKHGAAPDFVDGKLCFRFDDDADAERFRDRWL